MMAVSTTYYSEKKQYEHQIKDLAFYSIQTEALPVLKRRLKTLLDTNGNKVKMIDQYKKVSEEITKMFDIISSYSGKEDITQVV